MDEMIVETDRLIIKPWILSDIDSFISLCQKPGLNDFASSTYKDVTRDKAEAFVRKESQRFEISRAAKFAVHAKDGSGIIGVAGIFEMGDPYLGRFEINYRFPSEHWGKGVGTEVAAAMIDYGFKILELDRIYAIVLTANTRSRRVLDKIGMTLEHELMWHDSPAQLWSVAPIRSPSLSIADQ